MKKFFTGILVIVSAFILFCACKKDSNPPSVSGSDLTVLNGTWRCTVWITAGDTLIENFSSVARSGTITYMNPENFGYSVGEVVISNITSTSTANTFTATAETRSGANNSVVSNGTIHLIVSGSTMTQKYSDISGYPDLVFTKQ